MSHEQGQHGGPMAHHQAGATSAAAAPPPNASTSSHGQPNLSAAVRLPSVSLPSADLFETSAFAAGGRRQSINSDPFLHAFSAGHDANAGHARPGDPYRLVPVASGHMHGGAAHPDVHSQNVPVASHRNGVAGHGNGYNEQWQNGAHSTYNTHPPPTGPGAPDDRYAGPPPPSVGPLSSYRFGGPSQAPSVSGGVAAAIPSEDGPSYGDYSTGGQPHSRRANEPVSPRGGHSGRSTPMSGLKRKAGDDSSRGFPTFPGGTGHHGGSPPEPKRPTPTHGFDQMGQSTPQNGSQEIGSHGQDMQLWEDERRDSGGSGSYTSSAGGHSYSLTSYAPPHSMPSSSSNAYDSRPQSAHAPNQSLPYSTPWDARAQQGHHPQLEPAHAAQYPRRPSIPSVSQMMQGLPPDFVGTPYAPPPAPSGSMHGYDGSARSAQPVLTVSSVPATPSEQELPRQPRSASNPAFLPAAGTPVQPSRHPNPHAGPPPGWENRSQPSTRQSSNGSLHLDPLSLASGLTSKDSPYSRSPELRVSHKLAERKRRKEMTQLFEDLRDSLPFERGLKASKWEILSKAIDYVAQLKSYTAELVEDNRNLRQHYGLPPGPVMPMPDGPTEGTMGGFDSGGGGEPRYNDHPHEQDQGGSQYSVGPAGEPSSVANAAPSAPPRQLHWHEQRMDHDPSHDRKPNTASHFAKQTGHSPVIPSRLHAQFGGTASHSSTPQPSPTLPQTGSGPNSPAVNRSDSPHTSQLERAMTVPPVSAV
ncbi:hypothetical protein JCM3774_005640 [Rhodotorula dairenensis]